MHALFTPFKDKLVEIAAGGYVVRGFLKTVCKNLLIQNGKEWTLIRCQMVTVVKSYEVS